MMLHKKSPRQSYLKLLALLPIVAVALALNAETVTDVVYQQPQKKMVKKGKKNATIKMGSTNDIMVIEQPPAIQEKVEPVEMPNALEVEKQDGAFDVVEEMPQYPGGPKALFEFLSNTVNYPEEAEKAGTQGRVIATFVVEKDGSISGAKVVKSVDPLLDAEALRVINAMPNWTPGKQNGKVVRVKYTVPISFNLDGNNDSPKIVGIPNLEGYSLMVDGEKTDIGLLKELSPFKLKSMSINKKEKSVTVTTFKSPVVQHILYYLLSAREKAKNETGREINTNNQTITINGKVMTLNEIEESSLSMKNLGPVIVDDSYNIIVNTK